MTMPPDEVDVSKIPGTIHPNLRAFGDEDVSHIPDGFHVNSIEEMITVKYYHKDRPENMTVRPNKEDPSTLYVYDGIKWLIRPIDDVLSKMIKSMCKIEWLEDIVPNFD
jgi:hypothetical protein